MIYYEILQTGILQALVIRYSEYYFFRPNFICLALENSE